MTCLCTINGILLEISEAEIIGILCSIIDTFDYLPFDVDVSHIKNPFIFPKFDNISWTLKNKYTKAKTFRNSQK